MIIVFRFFFVFAMEGHLVLLLMSSKKQPRIISLENPLASSEAAGMLPGMYNQCNIWVFLSVFPLTIEGCTQQSCSSRPRELPCTCVGWSWLGLVPCGLLGLLWYSPGGWRGLWGPAWLCLGSSGKEAGHGKKICENDLHVVEMEQEELFPTGSS